MRTQTPYVNPLLSENLSVNDVLLLPAKGILTSRADAKLKPFIYSAPMDTVTGYGMSNAMVALGEHPVVCRFLHEDWNRTFTEHMENPNVFFAIGAKEADLEDFLYRLNNTKPAYGSVSVSIDIAHGDSVMAHSAATLLSKSPYIGNIMSGSLCTPEGAERAWAAGCTHLRVGVGPGAACTTRLMTGCGYPQLKAIYIIAKYLEAKEIDIEIIADGGIKYSGDAVKYLAAGADAIMLGSRFSSCIESAGWFVNKDNRREKKFRGQASREFQISQYAKDPACPEGASGPTITPKGFCKNIVEEFRGGVASAISYLGLSSIEELNPTNVYFVKITQAAYIEGTPHGTK